MYRVKCAGTDDCRSGHYCCRSPAWIRNKNRLSWWDTELWIRQYRKTVEFTVIRAHLVLTITHWQCCQLAECWLHNSKWAEHKSERLDQWVAELGTDFTRKGWKGVKFSNIFVVFTFPLWMNQKTEFSPILTLKWYKSVIKREIKGHFYKGAEYFSAAAEYFGQSGRIILKRVGNTVHWVLF